MSIRAIISRYAVTLTVIVCLIASLQSCRQRNTGRTAATVSPKEFPVPKPPSMLTDEGDIIRWLGKHYWESFCSLSGRTDSAHVVGVRLNDVREHMAAYMQIIHSLSIEEASRDVAQLYDLIAAAQMRLFREAQSERGGDTIESDNPDESVQGGAFYETMTQMVCGFLYDPNSIWRSEDLYLPFVSSLVDSPLTADEKRPGYRFEQTMCSLNPYMSTAPDFSFKDARGRIGNLNSVHAGHIILFFSNPGCQSCKDIIDALCSRTYLDSMIQSGRLAIVNIYIDEEIDTWLSYEKEYPRNWINAYDYKGVINSDELYFVRAIPSVYLLDSEHRILLKDAPVERILAFLDAQQTKEQNN